MVRQYIVFAAVLLIAVFVASQLEWGQTSPQNMNTTASPLQEGDGENTKSSAKKVSTKDLRAGSGARSLRRLSTAKPFTAATDTSQYIAASSSPFAATSTAFQAGSYSGVKVEFSPLSESTFKSAGQDETK